MKGKIMENGKNKAKTTELRYVDRPDLAETFADAINGVIFDGQSLRIEFGVTRLDEIKTDTSIKARRFPAARLVLTPAAAVDLINRMQKIGEALTNAGVVKVAQPVSVPEQTADIN
jgi:hypothetical protein